MRKIRVSLNAMSFSVAANDIQEYSEEFEDKLERLVEELGKVGVRTANSCVGGTRYSPYLIFYTEIKEKNSDGVKGVLVAKKTSDLYEEWERSDGHIRVAVNPLTMSEYGSGSTAVEPTGKQEHFLKNLVGRGTFTYPEQTENHALSSDVWRFATKIDENGKLSGWVSTKGFTPTRPLHKAIDQIISDANEIARKVFR